MCDSLKEKADMNHYSNNSKTHHFISRKLIRVFALFLSATMIIPLTSCNKKSTDQTILPTTITHPAPTDSDSVTPSDNDPSLTSESGSDKPISAKYVRATDDFYSDETVFMDVPRDPSREFQGQSVPFMAFAGNTIVLVYHKEYYLKPEETEEYNNLDFSKKEESERGFEIQALTQQYSLAFFNLKGESISSLKMPNQVNIVGLFGTKDDRVGVFTSEFVDDSSAGTIDQAQKHIIKLSYYSAAGELMEEHILDEDTSAAFGDYYSEVIPMENGNLLVYTGANILILDSSGKALAQEEIKLPSSTIFTEEGKYYVVFTETNLRADKTTRHTYIQEIDPNTAKLKDMKETYTLTEERVITSDGQCFTVGQRDSICRSDFVNCTVETIIEWSNTNLPPPESIAALKVLSNDDVYFLHSTTEGTGEKAVTTACLTHLHKEAVNPYAGKKTIYVASCVVGNEDFDKLLAEYNKRPESKARVIAYVEGSDISMDYQKQRSTAADRMLLNMKSGNGPDILLNCSEFGQFNSRDVLIDLNTYMDGPNGIDRSKYFDNIFRSYEVDGKLYQMPLNVGMNGLVGNPDILGRIDSWTIDDFDKKMDSLGTQTLPLLGHSSNLRDYSVSEPMGLLLELLFHDMGHYVNYSSYTTNFDCDDFRRLLEISKKYGGRANPDTIQQLFEEYDDMFHDAYCLMMQDGVCSIRTFYCGGLANGGFAQYAGLCHGDALFLGWPTSSGKGLSSEAGISVGISAYSECPDEAWDFVAFLLSPESQSSLSGVHWGGICIHRECERDGLLREIEEYRNGRRQSDEPVTNDQIDRFITLIEKIDTSIHTDPTIAEIVAEEAPAFFNGQKSADEVSRIIQDRAGRVIAEMK